MALALNGKKRKIKKTDFIASMQSSGLDEKVIENKFRKWRIQLANAIEF